MADGPTRNAPSAPERSSMVFAQVVNPNEFIREGLIPITIVLPGKIIISGDTFFGTHHDTASCHTHSPNREPSLHPSRHLFGASLKGTNTLPFFGAEHLLRRLLFRSVRWPDPSYACSGARGKPPVTDVARVLCGGNSVITLVEIAASSGAKAICTISYV